MLDFINNLDNKTSILILVIIITSIISLTTIFLTINNSSEETLEDSEVSININHSEEGLKYKLQEEKNIKNISLYSHNDSIKEHNATIGSKHSLEEGTGMYSIFVTMDDVFEHVIYEGEVTGDVEKKELDIYISRS